MRILSLIIILLFTVNLVHATDYYLDVDATGTGDGLSIENAFTSFAAVTASSFGAGDTLWISGGSTTKTYNLSATYKPVSGTTFKINPAPGHNGVAILDGGNTLSSIIYLGNRSDITIDGEINGERHLRLQNWGGVGAGNRAIAISGYGTGSVISNLIIRYIDIINYDTTCTVSDCTDMELKNCIYLSKSGGGTLIEHNYLEGCIREAIVLGGNTNTQPDTFEENIVQYNEIKGFRDHLGRGGPDGVKGCGHSTIRYNKIYHEELANAEYNKNHAAEDGIQILANYVRVYGNEVFGYSQGPIRTDQADVDQVYIYNNLLYATAEYGLQRGIQLDLINTADNVHICNNTIVGFKFLGIDIKTRNITTLANVNVYNNILVDNPMTVGSQGTGLNIDISNNLCLNEDYSNRGCPTQVNDPYDPQKTFAFTNYSLGSPNNDFSLANTNNMAINAGIDLSATFTQDINQQTRSTWDLGAFSFNLKNSTTPVIKIIRSL